MTLPEAPRICVVLLTGLGDVVLGLPLVNAIRDRYPAARITWVAEPMPAGILHAHPSVDEVVVYRKKDGVRGVARLARELSGRRFDLTLNLNVYFKSVWPTLLSRAPVRWGFGRERAFEGVWLTATHRLPPRPRAHTQDMFLEFLEALGIARPAELEWRLGLTEAERAEQSGWRAELGARPLAAIVPATATPKKDWLPERWARVAASLTHDFGFRVVLVGGPGEREARMAREIADASGVNPVWALGDGVRRLAWTLGAGDLVLAPDTGPVHIARALEVPVIGLYGHTNPWRVGPYRAYQELWVDRYTEPDEAPDPSRFDPKLGRMERITVEDVLGRVQHAVDRYGVGR
jgi:heptosyltransferase I